MRKATGLMMLGLAWGIAFQSCIFQTDPARPNSPPYIKDFSPEDLLLVINAPDDSIMFNFTAVDPEGDKITCSFVLVDIKGEVMEVLSYKPYCIFNPKEGGFYHLQGRARDHSGFVARDWYVTAIELHNDPPVIVLYSPDQDSIYTLKDSTIEFNMVVEDDHPEDLRYSYYAGGEPIMIMGEISSIQHRFTENGFFDVTGLVWDGEYGDTLSWVVRVVEEPDTVAPARITDLIGWTGPETGTIKLQWTASGDDDMSGRAYQYCIRTRTIHIYDENDWDRASQAKGAPVPGSPGTTEEMIVEDLNPGTWLYVTVRAVDNFGNISQLGNCIRLLVRGIGVVDGCITDAATGAPLEGIVVSAEENACTTSAEGYYMLTETYLNGDLIMLRDEDVAGDQGAYYDMAIPVSDINWHFSQDLSMMPYFDLVSILHGSYDGSFYKFFREMTYTKGLLGRPTIFRNWNHFPVTVYNPPFSWLGVDTRELARIAMTSWNDLTGQEFFIEISDPDAADVEIIYDTENNLKHHVETVSLNEDGTPAKKQIWIYPINQLSPIQIKGRMIFAHELGHVLQLGHSYDLGHLMVGGTAPMRADASQDEINLVRALFGMPTIFDATWYLDE